MVRHGRPGSDVAQETNEKILGSGKKGCSSEGSKKKGLLGGNG